MYSIKEVSDLTGITSYTLRFYEKEGILPPILRDTGGRRRYSRENITWLDIVTCLKKTNMNMSDIRKIVSLTIEGDSTIEQRKQIMIDHRIKMVKQLEELKQYISKIDKKIAFYEGAESCD